MKARERKGKTSNKNDNSLDYKNEEDKHEETSGFPIKRMIIRFLLAMITMGIVYFTLETDDNAKAFAQVSESLMTKRTMEIDCSESYKKEAKHYPDCVPNKCGRVVTDAVITAEEAKHLLNTAKAGLAYGGSNGGASILDLHSGALSKGDRFINIYKLLQEDKSTVFTENDLQNYRNVKNKIHSVIAQHFQVPKENLFLTSPTFFSQMTTKPAQTIHDEYWHVHTDKETYGSFHYTSLVYLTEYGKDFTGGRFVFVDDTRNITVEPKPGRLSFFTSGAENPHYVEKLKSGIRYAITVSFTCDASKAIEDPTL